MILNEIISMIDPEITKNYPDMPIKKKYRLSVLAQKKRNDLADMEEEENSLQRKRRFLQDKARHLSVDTNYWQERFDIEKTRTTRKALEKASKKEGAVWADIQALSLEVEDLRKDIERVEGDLYELLGGEEDPMPNYM